MAQPSTAYEAGDPTTTVLYGIVRGGDVRAVYYTVLAIVVAWGMIAMRLAQPIVLLKVGAK